MAEQLWEETSLEVLWELIEQAVEDGLWAETVTLLLIKNKGTFFERRLHPRRDMEVLVRGWVHPKRNKKERRYKIRIPSLRKGFFVHSNPAQYGEWLACRPVYIDERYMGLGYRIDDLICSQGASREAVDSLAEYYTNNKQFSLVLGIDDVVPVSRDTGNALISAIIEAIPQTEPRRDERCEVSSLIALLVIALSRFGVSDVYASRLCDILTLCQKYNSYGVRELEYVLRGVN